LTLAFQIFLGLAALLVVQSLVALRDGFKFLRYFCRCRREPLGGFAPPAAVIIPCKGVGAGFDAHVEAFLAQDYPRFQLIFVVASEKDSAHVALAARLAASRPGAGLATKLVVAGYADGCGEKVTNLRRGFEAADSAAEVLVFADIDARPGREWLRALVAPLGDSGVMVSTGFRWYLPGGNFASRLRAAWDTSVATLLGDHDHNFAWGGSMAVRAADFRRLQVAERHWSGTVSDDYALTRAVREAGGHIHFEPRCLVASREDSTFAALLRWTNRQIIITRVYAPHLWRMGLAGYSLYVATMLLGLALLVLPATTAPARAAVAGLLAIIQFLGIAKGGLRSMVAREHFPEEAESLARDGGCYWQLAPLVPWVMLYNFLVAGFVRRIEWHGTEYELLSAREVRVLRRSGG